MGKAVDLKLLFEALIFQFGFGKLTSFRATNISSRIPKYKNVKVVEMDLQEKVFYSGKYTGYDDDELMEVIDTHVFQPEEGKYDILNENRESLVRNGKLLHFRDIDRILDLPPGTAKRLLNIVAGRYSLKPTLEKDNIVRYERI